MAVLAYYSIRSKQAYIFRTNYLLEITGGSKLIANAYDLLFSAAWDEGLKTRDCDDTGSGPFSARQLCEEFASGNLQMAEVYRGGGNDTVLFDSMESFRLANAAFTYRLLRDCPGMTPICAGVEVDLSSGGNYQEDWKRLTEAVALEKARMLPRGISDLMPFSLQDHTTLQPVERKMQGKDVSAESAAKRIAGRETGSDLDSMVTEKGEESLLAIVHADGNRMGEKVRRLLAGCTDYDTCVQKLRDFSRRTDEVFARKSCDAVDRIADGQPIRWLIRDGDDVTFICNARNALRFTRTYLQAVEAEDGGEYTSCAGICIFHSHYPCYMAYEMAEAACESAKKALRETGTEQGSLIDFHYIHSGLSTDLEELREFQGTSELIARPFRLHRNTPGSRLTLEDLDGLAGIVHRNHIARTNIKGFGSALEISRLKARAELTRIGARAPGLRTYLNGVTDNPEQQDALLYDFSEIYDLWYSDGKNREEE